MHHIGFIACVCTLEKTRIHLGTWYIEYIGKIRDGYLPITTNNSLGKCSGVTANEKTLHIDLICIILTYYHKMI